MHKITHVHVRNLYFASVDILEAIDGDIGNLDKQLSGLEKSATNEEFVQTIVLFLHNTLV